MRQPTRLRPRQPLLQLREARPGLGKLLTAWVWRIPRHPGSFSTFWVVDNQERNREGALCAQRHEQGKHSKPVSGNSSRERRAHLRHVVFLLMVNAGPGGQPFRQARMSAAHRAATAVPKTVAASLMAPGAGRRRSA